MTLQLGVLASGAGLTLKHILNACETGVLDASVQVVISNNSKSGALRIAKTSDIPAIHVSSATHPSPHEEQRRLADALVNNGAEWVVLAGWTKKVGEPTLTKYRNKILNIHPAISPMFDGIGMYGDKVHQAVLESGVDVTGARVHLVDEHYDSGRTLSQVEVDVLPGDDVRTLSERVKIAERALLVDTLSKIAAGQIL